MPPRSSSRIANSSPPRRAAVSPVPASAADAIGDGLQQLVADGVAEGVVDRFEVVEVDEQHDHRVGLGARHPQGVIHAIEEQRPVGEPGQLVVEGAVAELALEVALLGDVAERGDDAVDGGAAEEVGDDHGRLAVLAVGVDQRRLELDRAAVAELDEPFELADRAVALLLVDDVEQVPPDPALGVVAERRPKTWAGVADTAVWSASITTSLECSTIAANRSWPRCSVRTRTWSTRRHMRARASTITLTVAAATTTNDAVDSRPVASIRISAPSGTSAANSKPKICVQ